MHLIQLFYLHVVMVGLELQESINLESEITGERLGFKIELCLQKIQQL